MNRKMHPLVITVLGLVSAALACGLPVDLQPAAPSSAGGPESIGTYVVQTQTAAALLNTPVPPTPAPSLTSTPSPTMIPMGTASPTATLTATLLPTGTISFTPTFTLESFTVTISVTIPTNCRTGPGKVYDYNGALLVGETTEVVGWDGSGEFWYVRNPDEPGGFCWLWDEYAIITGNASILPLLTPPPTPTPSPDFEILSAEVEVCGDWYITVKVKNSGPVDFESVSVKVRDLDTDISAGSPKYDNFESWVGCVKDESQDTLESGQKGYVASNTFNYNPTGHDLKITVHMCTEDDEEGSCINRTGTFTP